MAEDYSEIDSLQEEEEEENQENSPLRYFGHEMNRCYSGEKIEEIHEILKQEKEEGSYIIEKDQILDHRYQVKSLIGHGTFCLVWLAYDHILQQNVAIKILKQQDEEIVKDEYILNRYLSDEITSPHVRVVKFYRMFSHMQHPCLVFELVAQNILTYINYFDAEFVGIPIPLIKKIVKDTLKGLDFMHKLGAIHTDLKPENVMASRPLFPYTPFPGSNETEVFNALEDDPNTIDFKLGDIGNSCFVNNPVNDLIQTRQYRSPEVLLGLPYDTSADIWSLACMTFELATRKHLFDPTNGDDEDDLSENRHVFDAIHLSMIENVLGRVPEDWAKEGKNYNLLFNEDGELRHVHSEQMSCVYDLIRIHGLPKKEGAELADFLEPMLAIIPSQRPSAEELLQSPWLHQIK